MEQLGRTRTRAQLAATLDSARKRCQSAEAARYAVASTDFGASFFGKPPRANPTDGNLKMAPWASFRYPGGKGHGPTNRRQY